MRSQKTGFSLLECMLAFAAAGIILSGVYTVAIRSSQQQIHAEQDYAAHAMARAILDEYTLTYPAMQRSGTYRSQWVWLINEESIKPIQPTEFDTYFNFVKVTATVNNDDTGSTAQLKTIVARRSASR